MNRFDTLMALVNYLIEERDMADRRTELTGSEGRRPDRKSVV